MQTFYKRLLGSRQRVLMLTRFVLVFVIILVAAKFGQYIFFGWQTSPAVLWPATGIAVAIMWLYGYRYALPIFLGLLVGSLTGPNAHVFPMVITTPLSQVLGQMLGVYLLRRLRFEGEFANMRSVMVFFLSIIVLAMVSPMISIVISHFTGINPDSSFTTFSRRWAGYAFSCLILTPFIIALTIKDKYPHNNRLIETALAGIFLSIATYMLFWTRLPQDFGFLFFALFFIAVIWVCLRFSSRVVTLSVVYITVFGILGLFLSPAPGRVLNSQVFAAELFLFIVVPIMYAYSALMKERQNNLEELKLALTKIERENTNKTNFIAVLAHELRNPLATIKSTFELLKFQKLEPETRLLVEAAYNQAHVMRRLLDDLLDVTRVTQGKFELKIQDVQLLPLLHKVADATRTVVEEHEQTLDLKADISDYIFVRVDPMRFEQVLVNVINNASKFTPSGGRIEVSCRVIGSDVEVRISDNGRGIEVENLENIFQSFWQIRNASGDPASGIGVGLALARQIVTLHHGSIWAESKGLGQGSTFVISIPCITQVSKVGEKKSETAVVLPPLKILVVDDNMPAANALAQLLSIKGHSTTTHYSAKDVLEVIKQSEPEVILLDIGLPDMNGYEVAKLVRSVGYKGMLIAVSGYGQQEDKEAAEQAGFDAHFTKPLAVESLESFLYGWVQRRKKL